MPKQEVSQKNNETKNTEPVNADNKSGFVSRLKSFWDIIFPEEYTPEEKLGKKIAISLSLFLLATFISYVFDRLNFPDTNMIVVYMLAVLLIVWISNNIAIGIVASVAAVFAFNFFFSEPLYTFSVRDPNYLVNFIILMFTVFVMGTISARATRAAHDAKLNEEQRLMAREETVKERYRANLLRSISHDIRTPLSGIVGSAEMLIDMTDDSDPRRAIATDIASDADWLHGMVDNILSLTRLQAEDLTINKKPEAAEEVVGSAINKVEKKLDGRTVEAKIPRDVFLIPMDARLIEQVLINLLDNAIKHTVGISDENSSGPIGKIIIEVSESAGRYDDSVQVAKFQVTDNGTGIPETDLTNIFQTFYTKAENEGRLSGDRSAEGSADRNADRSMGLGLAICDTIVRAHGGAIYAENIHNSGALFTFELPLE